MKKQKPPVPYREVWALAEDGKEYLLCYCNVREAFIEPVTGDLAEEVIGPIIRWRYTEAPTYK